MAKSPKRAARQAAPALTPMAPPPVRVTFTRDDIRAQLRFEADSFTMQAGELGLDMVTRDERVVATLLPGASGWLVTAAEGEWTLAGWGLA